MLCDDCNIKEATVHSSKTINGIKEEIHLCDDCAKKNDAFNFENNFSIHNFLSNLLEGNMATNTSVNNIENKKCPQCGSTYNDFKKNGRLGCDMCYSTFANMLAPLIRRIQSNNTHSGKIPKRAGASIRLARQIKDLKEEMQLLVEKEEFEDAAKIRDEIKKLEEDMDNEQEV